MLKGREGFWGGSNKKMRREIVMAGLPPWYEGLPSIRVWNDDLKLFESEGVLAAYFSICKNNFLYCICTVWRNKVYINVNVRKVKISFL